MDRPTSCHPAGEPSGQVEAALEQLHLDGAIFFRSEFTEPFAFESAPLALADTLHPGAERLILFHIVARGVCWVSVAGGDRCWARQGDVIVMPYGDAYVMGGETPAECVSLQTLVVPPPWVTMPVLRHGGGGTPTGIVCGFLHSDHRLSIRPCARCHRCSSYGCRRARHRSGCARALPTREEMVLSNRSTSVRSADGLPEPCRSRCPRGSGDGTGRRPGGSRRSAIRCWRPHRRPARGNRVAMDRRRPRSTRCRVTFPARRCLRHVLGLVTSSGCLLERADAPRRRAPRENRLTVATVANASATTRRKPSVERSSASAASHRPTGAWLTSRSQAQVTAMFLFSRKKLSGSYFCFRLTSRS